MSMDARIPSLVAFCLALCLGGATSSSVSADAEAARGAVVAGVQSTPSTRAVRSVAHTGPRVGSRSLHRVAARRARVKRRRPRSPEIRPVGPGGQRLARTTRTPTAHEPFGGAERARASRSDGAARNRTPRLRRARLGRDSTWCTSVPPPTGLLRILT